MAAVAARKIRLKASGAAVAFADEACTDSGDHLTYQITNTAKRVWDRTVAIVVKKDGVAQAATLYALNRLSGKITFGISQGAGVITVSGSYLPMALVAQGRMVSIVRSADNADVSAFGDADVVRMQIQHDVGGRIGRFHIDDYFRDALSAGTVFLLEFSADDAGTTPWMKAWALLGEEATDGSRAGVLGETISFTGSADADGRAFTTSV